MSQLSKPSRRTRRRPQIRKKPTFTPTKEQQGIAISMVAKEIPETFDVNITIPEADILREYEELSTKAAKHMMTIYLTQLAVNSAIGMVVKIANQTIPGGTDFDSNAQDAINKLFDDASHISIMEFALSSMGYTQPEARMFAQSYALKARDIALQAPLPAPAPQRKLPKEVEDVLDKMSAIMTKTPAPSTPIPRREERKQTRSK